MTFQYRVEAMDFILKDNPAEAKVKLRECLLNAMERHTRKTNKTHKVYTLEVGRRKISVLDGCFVCCHRAFLVNKQNIKEIDWKERIIHFANGEHCLMSTRMRKGLE